MQHNNVPANMIPALSANSRSLWCPGHSHHLISYLVVRHEVPFVNQLVCAMPPNDRTPLIDRQGLLPTPLGSPPVQDHPIFLRVCHPPCGCLSQSCLVYIRGFLVTYLTVLMGMLLHYEINWREKDDGYTPWRIPFQFSSLSFALLWLYHVIAFFWSFTHLYYPHLDEYEHRWESVILWVMSPPIQTPGSRKRLYFSLFYTIVHVFAAMNVIIYWVILVPNGHGHLPKGKYEGFPTFDAIEDFFTSDGWFHPFCIVNLWVVTGLIAFAEVLFLNSVRRQVPVPIHLFMVVFFLGWYLGWAAIGQMLTGYPPFFWMDRKAVGKNEIVAAYAVGFISLGVIVFCFLYGLVGMRENITHCRKATPEVVKPQSRIEDRTEDPEQEPAAAV
ncbi:hypothetical protein V8F20_007336 [Naviculisporaceae sp. PSN 640]